MAWQRKRERDRVSHRCTRHRHSVGFEVRQVADNVATTGQARAAPTNEEIGGSEDWGRPPRKRQDF